MSTLFVSESTLDRGAAAQMFLSFCGRCVIPRRLSIGAGNEGRYLEECHAYSAAYQNDIQLQTPQDYMKTSSKLPSTILPYPLSASSTTTLCDIAARPQTGFPNISL
jgi:hypothetical protein